MGRRGPARTPTKTLKLRGSWLAKTRKNEPQPTAGKPECPDHLVDEAREHWDLLVSRIEDLGILAKCDDLAMAACCQVYAEWIKATKVLNEEGRYQETEHGTKKHPAVEVQQQSLQKYKLYLAEFGLTPASRSRVESKEKPQKETAGKSRFFKSG